ncbi:MAG: hypothetical protein JRI91_01000 [Deltaproteobacteria bacterium]|nr:hypothetical protein [Deltaproteobacteria bacterium]
MIDSLPPHLNSRAGFMEKLNRIFEKIGAWSYDHRWIMLGICFAVLSVCTYFAKDIRFDNSLEAFFDRDDPV